MISYGAVIERGQHTTRRVELASAKKTPKKSMAATFLALSAGSQLERTSTYCFQLPLTFLSGMKKTTHPVVTTHRNRFNRKIHLQESWL